MNRPRKILMLVENLPVPSDRRVWSEATALRDSGFGVCIICPKGATQQNEGYVCCDNIHIYRYSLPAGHSPLTYMSEYLIAFLKTFYLSLWVWLRHGFDVIHSANPPDLFFMIGLFYRLFGKKFVFDQHDLAPEMLTVLFEGRTGLKILHKLLLLFEWCSYHVAHVIIVTNKSQEQVAVGRGSSSCSKVVIVRNGPDLMYMHAVTPETELKRGRAYLLVYLGVMGVQDGIEYALHALYELVHKRGRQDVSLVLIGKGDRMPALQKLLCELRLDEYGYFVGWMETKDILRYLSVADIGLSPDPANGVNEFSTMIKTMEYMAMGKPVVAFDIAETRFSARDAALYAAPNLVEDYADKIEILLNDAELRSRMGLMGRRYIEEELSWDHSKRNLLYAYRLLFPRYQISYKDGSRAVLMKQNDYEVSSTNPD